MMRCLAGCPVPPGRRAGPWGGSGAGIVRARFAVPPWRRDEQANAALYGHGIPSVAARINRSRYRWADGKTLVCQQLQ